MFNPLDLLQNDVQTFEQTDVTATVDVPALPMLDINSFEANNSKLFNHPDPLSQAMHYEMPTPKLHIVKPHFVDGYIRADGTVVDGYYRDGGLADGSYLRSNPDEFIENNLNNR